MSELTNNSNLQDQTSKSELCVSCRQFFGNSSQENLCSKCYRDKYKAGLPTNKSNEQSNNSTSKSTANILAKEDKMAIEETKANDSKTTEQQKSPVLQQTDTTRCWKCSKKVGLLGFKCKCDFTYCKLHRLPEEHECTVDFAKLGKERLAKENVALKADKLEKM